jgi:hypothetical protein
MFSGYNLRQSRLIQAAAKAGFPYYCKGTNPSVFHPALMDSGLLIISRLPIVYDEFLPFK